METLQPSARRRLSQNYASGAKHAKRKAHRGEECPGAPPQAPRPPGRRGTPVRAGGRVKGWARLRALHDLAVTSVHSSAKGPPPTRAPPARTTALAQSRRTLEADATSSRALAASCCSSSSSCSTQCDSVDGACLSGRNTRSSSASAGRGGVPSAAMPESKRSCVTFARVGGVPEGTCVEREGSPGSR